MFQKNTWHALLKDQETRKKSPIVLMLLSKMFLCLMVDTIAVSQWPTSMKPAWPLAICKLYVCCGLSWLLYICYSPTGRSVLGETVPTASGGTQTEGTVSLNTDRPRPVNNIFIFSNSNFEVSGKFFFTLQPKCVEVRLVLVDEARDRLQTKTKHYNMIFSSVIYIMALTALFSRACFRAERDS